MSNANNTIPATLDDQITAWVEAEKAKVFWEQREKELRLHIFASNFASPTPGMNKVKIGHGMALVGDYRLNYKVDKPLLTELLKEPVTAGVFDEILTYKPEVSGSKFRKLDDDRKRLVAPAITETPGTPGLEVKPQSKVRW